MGKVELMFKETPRQAELRESARQWREYAATASPEGLQRVCSGHGIPVWSAEADDGIARCVCCGEPLGGMWGCL